MNYLNYIKHSVFTPDTYHRRYEHDVEGGNELMQRVALAALPFVALYRPAGMALSLSLGGCRAFSHLSAALSYQQESRWNEMGVQLSLSGAAVLSVAGAVFHFGVGLLVTTLLDIGQGLYQMRSLEEAGQVAASGLYLGFMVTGTLEVILLSTVVQGLVALAQARKEWHEGHYIEAGAKVALASVRGYQGLEYQKKIELRDVLFSLKKYAALTRRAERGREVRHLLSHEMVDLERAIDEKRVVLESPEYEYEFGSHVHGYGQGIVKGGNLTFRNVGGAMVLEFKVNHTFRKRLEQVMTDLGHLRGKEVKEILSLTGSHATHLSVDREGSLVDFLAEGGRAPVALVTLEGLGSVSVGVSRSVLGEGPFKIPNLYDKVVVRMEPNKTLFDLHELLAFLDLDGALVESSKEDIDRLKLGHLFRSFFPREALPLERSEAFFSHSLDALRQEMIARAPHMQEVYDTYFEKMSPEEILPGRIRYRMEGLGEEVRKEGMACLTTAVTGSERDEDLFSRVASILSMGMISTEFRDAYHVNAEGLSRPKDYMAGGADALYFQMMPQSFIDKKQSLQEFSWYHSRVRLQVSLKALELGSYQYATCGLGNRDFSNGEEYRRGAQYDERLGILEFAKMLNQSKDWQELKAHEVMLKERLDASYIEEIWVQDEATKKGLLDYLRARGMTPKIRVEACHHNGNIVD
jgi:hypothetical protein